MLHVFLILITYICIYFGPLQTMSRTDKTSIFGSLKPFDEDDFVFQNFSSASIRYGQYHFENITEYLIFYVWVVQVEQQLHLT